MSKPRVRIYPDGHSEPVIDAELPSDITFDTRELEDGRHPPAIRVADEDGREGYEEIPFRIQNGPGVVVAGLLPNSTRRGEIHFTVDALSTEDAFDPRRAEARTWNVPAEYADTPTYSSHTKAPTK